MKKEKSNGLSFSQSQNSKMMPPLNIISSLAFYLIFTLAIENMLEIKTDIIPIASGFAVMVLILLFSFKQKLKLISNIVLDIILLIAIIIKNENVINGLRLLVNKTYSASQAHQNYAYTMLTVADNPGDITIVLAVIFIITAQLILLSLLKKSSIVPIVTAVVLVIFEAYFGIAPSVLLNVGIFVFIGINVLVLSNKNASQLIPATAVILLVSLLVGVTSYTVMSSKNQQYIKPVYIASEKIRDALDRGEQKLSGIADTDENDNKPLKNDTANDSLGDNANEEKGNLNGTGGTQKQSSNPKRVALTVMNILLVVIIALAIMIYAVLLLVSVIKRKRMLKLLSRRNLADEKRKSVMTLAFKKGVSLLTFGGVNVGNRHYIDYADDIEKIYSSDFKSVYINALTQWQKMLYSGERVSGVQALDVKAFYSLARQEVLKKSTFINKIKILLIKFM